MLFVCEGRRVQVAADHVQVDLLHRGHGVEADVELASRRRALHSGQLLSALFGCLELLVVLFNVLLCNGKHVLDQGQIGGREVLEPSNVFLGEYEQVVASLFLFVYCLFSFLFYYSGYLWVFVKDRHGLVVGRVDMLMVLVGVVDILQQYA